MKKLSIILSAIFFFSLHHPAPTFADQQEDKLIHFSGKSMEGKEIDVDTIIKEKPILLFFWATW